MEDLQSRQVAKIFPFSLGWRSTNLTCGKIHRLLFIPSRRPTGETVRLDL